MLADYCYCRRLIKNCCLVTPVSCQAFFISSQPSLFYLSPGVPEGTAAVKVSVVGSQPLPSLSAMASAEEGPRVTKILSRTPQGINGSGTSITGYAGAPGNCVHMCMCVYVLQMFKFYYKAVYRKMLSHSICCIVLDRLSSDSCCCPQS